MYLQERLHFYLTTNRTGSKFDQFADHGGKTVVIRSPRRHRKSECSKLSKRAAFISTLSGSHFLYHVGTQPLASYSQQREIVHLVKAKDS